MFLVAAALLTVQVDLGPEAPPMRIKPIVNPEFQVEGAPFTKVPSTSEVRAAYPLKLRATTSSVALICIAGEHGTVTKCDIRLADPDLPKPKAAALKLLRYFRVSASPGSKITIVMQFSGEMWRCLMPFCMPELIPPPPPPPPPPGVCIPPVTPEDGPPCPDAKLKVH